MTPGCTGTPRSTSPFRVSHQDAWRGSRSAPRGLHDILLPPLQRHWTSGSSGRSASSRVQASAASSAMLLGAATTAASTVSACWSTDLGIAAIIASGRVGLGFVAFGWRPRRHRHSGMHFGFHLFRRHARVGRAFVRGALGPSDPPAAVTKRSRITLPRPEAPRRWLIRTAGSSPALRPREPAILPPATPLARPVRWGCGSRSAPCRRVDRLRNAPGSGNPAGSPGAQGLLTLSVTAAAALCPGQSCRTAWGNGAERARLGPPAAAPPSTRSRRPDRRHRL